MSGAENAATAAAFGLGSRPPAAVDVRRTGGGRRGREEERERLADVRLRALFLPEQIVFAEEAPVAARLRRPPDVPRVEEGEDVKREFFGQQRNEITLKLRLDHRHHVLYLGGEKVGEGRREGGEGRWLRRGGGEEKRKRRER